MEPPPRENAVRRTAVLTACCLLGLTLCVAGCQTWRDQPATRSPPVGLKITTAEVESTGVQPGQSVTFRVGVWVGLPPGQDALRVSVRLRPFFHQQPLPERSDNRVSPRGHTSHTFAYPLPINAAEGTYVMEIVISEAQPAPGRRPVTAQTTLIFVVWPATPR
jgi:hypothetical protein